MINTPFILGAQDVSVHDLGAFTGEVAASQLCSMPVTFSLVGHSERRQHFHETSDVVIKKAYKLQQQGLLSIVCIGETLEEKKDFKKVLAAQLEGVFSLNPALLMIAYEPVWAIGTGLTASSEQAEEVHAFIRTLLTEKFGEAISEEVSILYGGSVKPDNAAELFSQKNIDGGLIGGAALKARDFFDIIKEIK
jgi:triosephosphate isomerase